MSRLIDWENMCLVCLQKGENRFIFGEDNDSNLIADKIMKCADILIKRDTNQPQNICLQCLDDLNVAYKFRRNCEQSDSIIKSLINTNHQEFQINNLWKTTPINLNPAPTQGTSIKDEILADNISNDENASCLDLEDDSDAAAKFSVEDRTDAHIHNNVMELNNMKANESNKSKQVTNEEIFKPPRGRPKKSIEPNYVKNHKRDKTKEGANLEVLRRPRGRPKKLTEDSCAKSSQIMDSVVLHNTSDDENTICLDIKFDPDTESELELEDHVDTSVDINTLELNNVESNQSSNTKQEMNNDISKRPRGRPKRSIELNYVKNNQEDKTKDDEVLRQPGRRPKKLTEESCAKPSQSMDNAALGHTSDGENTPRLDTKYDPENEDKVEVEDRADTSVQNNGIELNNVQPNQNDKTKQEMNCEISKRPRGRPKKIAGAPRHKYIFKKKRQKNICEICNHIFRSQLTLEVHMRRHNNERPFSCDQCDKAFVTDKELRCHVRVHTGQKPLKCRHCANRFSNYTSRNNHERSHTGAKPFVCSICSKSFAYPNALAYHLRSHTGVKNFVCNKCGKAFTKKVSLEKHMANHPAQDELNKSSEKTQEKQIEKEIFQIEENPNSNEINIKHEIVEVAVVEDKSDSENTSCVNLENNPVTEVRNDKIIQQLNGRTPKSRPKKTEVSPKVCEICNRSLKDQRSLNEHMRRHNNVRPFSCDHCDKAFVTSTDLSRHVRVHTGQKPYKCRYCDRRFSHYTGRQGHERTHTGEKPFECSICSKSFAHRSALTHHFQTHADAMKFACNECGKEFPKKELLKKHIDRHMGREELD